MSDTSLKNGLDPASGTGPAAGRETRLETRLERDEDVAIIRIVNSARMNPLTVQMQTELRAHLALLRADTGVRALLLTGEGRAFCVGADLASMASPPADGRTLGDWTADTMHELTNQLLLELRSLPFPLVVALNGAAAGAGVGLALAGDVTIAGRSAYFLMSFLPKLGLVPDMGSSWFIARRVGQARAAGLSLLGDRLGGELAAAWGLIWSCVEDAALADEALAVARRLARIPCHAVQECRALFDAAAGNTLPAQLHYETERQRELIDGAAFAEGGQAFAERREPVFPARAAARD